MKKIFLILIVIAAITEGCKKYEDGPWLSFRSVKNRITGTWKVDKFYIDGIDSTDEYNAKLGCEILFTDEIYNPADDHNWKLRLYNCKNNKQYEAFWYFYAKKKDLINIDFLTDSTFVIQNSIGPFGNDRSAIWTILRLTNHEFNLKVEDYYDIYTLPHTKSYTLELKK